MGKHRETGEKQRKRQENRGKNRATQGKMVKRGKTGENRGTHRETVENIQKKERILLFWVERISQSAQFI